MCLLNENNRLSGPDFLRSPQSFPLPIVVAGGRGWIASRWGWCDRTNQDQGLQPFAGLDPRRADRTLAESFCIRSLCCMGTKRLSAISDYARHGFNLQVKCRECGRVSVIDARALFIECTRISVSRDRRSKSPHNSRGKTVSAIIEITATFALMPFRRWAVIAKYLAIVFSRSPAGIGTSCEPFVFD